MRSITQKWGNTWTNSFRFSLYQFYILFGLSIILDQPTAVPRTLQTHSTSSSADVEASKSSPCMLELLKVFLCSVYRTFFVHTTAALELVWQQELLRPVSGSETTLVSSNCWNLNSFVVQCFGYSSGKAAAAVRWSPLLSPQLQRWLHSVPHQAGHLQGQWKKKKKKR